MAGKGDAQESESNDDDAIHQVKEEVHARLAGG
jgi:hypothetical protein